MLLWSWVHGYQHLKLTFCLHILSSVRTQAEGSSEMLVSVYWTMWHHIIAVRTSCLILRQYSSLRMRDQYETDVEYVETCSSSLMNGFLSSNDDLKEFFKTMTTQCWHTGQKIVPWEWDEEMCNRNTTLRTRQEQWRRGMRVYSVSETFQDHRINTSAGSG